MGRMLAVMVVPYPPGIPLIMPGERLTAATKSIQDYLLYARDFDRKFPGLRDRHPRPALRADAADAALSGGLHRSRRRPMIPRDVKSPTIPIPFHKLLKVVAIVDRRGPADQSSSSTTSRPRSSRSRSADSFDRDVSEDAAVGAYIAMVDGDRSSRRARWRAPCAPSAFDTPLWALADSHRISDMAVLGHDRRGRRLHLSRPADAGLLRQAGRRQPGEYGNELLPPFFGGLMAYDGEANIAFDCPGHQGGQFYRKSPAGQLFFKHFGESIFRNDLCNADVDLGDLLIHEGPAVEAQRHAARVFGADKTYFVLNGTSTSNKIVTNAVLRAATWCCSTATTTSRCTRARWSRPARSRSSCRRRAIRSA